MTELPGMPRRDIVGEAAAKLVETMRATAAAIQAELTARTNLFHAMKKAHRSSVYLDGYTFQTRERKAMQTVAVKKTKGIK